MRPKRIRSPKFLGLLADTKNLNGVESHPERQGKGLEGLGGATSFSGCEGVDQLGRQEGQGRHLLRFHPSRHRHRHELGAQAPTFSTPEPRLIQSRLIPGTPKLRFGIFRCGSIPVCRIYTVFDLWFGFLY